MSDEEEERDDEIELLVGRRARVLAERATPADRERSRERPGRAERAGNPQAMARADIPH